MIGKCQQRALSVNLTTQQRIGGGKPTWTKPLAAPSKSPFRKCSGDKPAAQYTNFPPVSSNWLPRF